MTVLLNNQFFSDAHFTQSVRIPSEPRRKKLADIIMINGNTDPRIPHTPAKRESPALFLPNLLSDIAKPP